MNNETNTPNLDQAVDTTAESANKKSFTKKVAGMIAAAGLVAGVVTGANAVAPEQETKANITQLDQTEQAPVVPEVQEVVEGEKLEPAPVEATPTPSPVVEAIPEAPATQPETEQEPREELAPAPVSPEYNPADDAGSETVEVVPNDEGGYDTITGGGPQAPQGESQPEDGQVSNGGPVMPQ